MLKGLKTFAVIVGNLLLVGLMVYGLVCLMESQAAKKKELERTRLERAAEWRRAFNQ